MPGPPNDVPASELWRRLSESPCPSEVIDFPRRDARGKPLGQVRIQVLQMEQHDEARIRAHMALKTKRLDTEDLKGPSIQEVYGDMVARELLAMACVTPKALNPDDITPKYGRIFARPEDLGRLTADEINVLFTAYTMVQHRYGPYEGSIEDDTQLTAWLRRLVEGASAYPLAQRNWHQLVELTSSLAGRAYMLSAILESLYSTLPDTLQSSLAALGIGIGYFGEQPVNDIQNGSPHEIPDPFERPEGWTPPEPMTLEQAARAAERLHKGAL